MDKGFNSAWVMKIKPYLNRLYDFLPCFFTWIGQRVFLAIPTKYTQMKATQTKAISLAIRSGSVKWVSSKLNPPDLKALNMVSICHRSLYLANAA